MPPCRARASTFSQPATKRSSGRMTTACSSTPFTRPVNAREPTSIDSTS